MINQFLWEEILKEAERRGFPPVKKRAILREFLQVKFLTGLYRLAGCQSFSFIGGTSLRLLRGLDRFSEDLDFDNFGLSGTEVEKLFKKTTGEFRHEGYAFELDFRKTKNGGIGRLRFPDLLYQLKISSNPKEKLMMRLDYTYQKRVETEVLLLSKFGFSERVVTNALPVLLSQKTKALIFRKQRRGRDFYDIYWLLSRGVKPNFEVLEELEVKTEKEYFARLKEIYQREKKNLSFLKRQLRPFLLHEGNQRYLDLFGDFFKEIWEK